MYEIVTTELFTKWLDKLKDTKAKISIARRIERMSIGLFGDNKFIGDGISELRIDTGAGYRAYYTIDNGRIIILLIGGDKSTQSRDILKAKELKKELK
ncbi:Putative addiction module killer protein [Sulfurovum sp. enrichment culture clone C5]|uniref:Putative addiction module killer protein n=1 Tax=Sulfurovum sp. enrichment culture clone C5 TaxID=497650 RepID=A0A0S4XNI3_9BACT|nr:Putative addiction module killer protein [Sulfurovum sp. enrichment culture clone C5]